MGRYWNKWYKCFHRQPKMSGHRWPKGLDFRIQSIRCMLFCCYNRDKTLGRSCIILRISKILWYMCCKLFHRLNMLYIPWPGTVNISYLNWRRIQLHRPNMLRLSCTRHSLVDSSSYILSYHWIKRSLGRIDRTKMSWRFLELYNQQLCF